MYASVQTANIDNLSAKNIKVEVAAYNGLPGIKITGLPDAVVRESFHRVSTAFKSCKIEMPLKRFVVNFIPADVPKKGSGFDLPIATALLKAVGIIPRESLNNYLIFGELSLTGELRPVIGVLPVLNFAKEDFEKVIIPYANLKEASFFKEKAIPIKHLRDIIKIALGENIEELLEYHPISAETDLHEEIQKDFIDVKGQTVAVRAAEIAVIGNHHLLLIGSPGCGKTMIGERMPSIMPPLSNEEKLEVNSIYSIAGLLGDKKSIINSRPYRAPHHTTSDVALIGGVRMGEITLAHKGVLFLDELSEFKHNVLNAIREPIEKGTIDISRANYCHSMPANFLLIAASNPCDCGNYLKRDGTCNCPPQSLQRFRRRLNGPLMDRFDLKIVMTAPKITIEKFCSIDLTTEYSSSKMKQRVIDTISFKSDIKKKGVKQKITPDAKKILDRYIASNNLSLRHVRQTLNVAKTIASIEFETEIEEAHILESLNYTKPFNW